MLLHATCVEMNQKAVLLIGKPGAGKSDTALRLIELGGILVADDQVDLQINDGVLTARPPAAIEGLLEIRGVGIVSMPFCNASPVQLVVELVQAEQVDRLPEPQFYEIAGHMIPLLKLCAFEASTPVKIKTVLNRPELFFLEKK